MDNQTLLRHLYQDFNKRNFDAVLVHLHDEVAWPRAWEGGYVHGHDAVGARCDGPVRAEEWDRPSRPRTTKHTVAPRLRWELLHESAHRCDGVAA